MTPQRQTVFVATNPKRRGNCQSAAMASVLDLPLAEVIDTASDECRDAGFWQSVGDWLAGRGLKIVHLFPSEEAVGALKGLYSIGCGPSPRGPFWHAVVCKNGVMVFDPHPSDDGLLSIERHDIIVPMSAAELKLHHAKGNE